MSLRSRVGGRHPAAYPAPGPLSDRVPANAMRAELVRASVQMYPLGRAQRRQLATQSAMMHMPVRKPWPINLRSGSYLKAYQVGLPRSYARPYNAEPAVPGEPSAAGQGLVAHLEALFRR